MSDRPVSKRVRLVHPASAYPGRPAIWFSLDDQVVWNRLYAGRPAPKIVLGARLDVLDADRETESSLTLDGARSGSTFRGDASALEGSCLVSAGKTGFRWDPEKIARITLVVRSDEVASSQSVEAGEYWAFVVRVPLSEVVEQSKP